MEFIFAAAVIFTIGLSLVGFYQSDQLMRILRERHPDNWRESGYPCGYFKCREALRDHWWERDKINEAALWWVKFDGSKKTEKRSAEKRIVFIAALIHTGICGIIFVDRHIRRFLD